MLFLRHVLSPGSEDLCDFPGYHFFISILTYSSVIIHFAINKSTWFCDVDQIRLKPGCDYVLKRKEYVICHNSQPVFFCRFHTVCFPVCVDMYCTWWLKIAGLRPVIDPAEKTIAELNAKESILINYLGYYFYILFHIGVVTGRRFKEESRACNYCTPKKKTSTGSNADLKGAAKWSTQSVYVYEWFY